MARGRSRSSVDLAAIEAALARAVKTGDAIRELVALRALAAGDDETSKPDGGALRAARASYRTTHWGLGGDGPTDLRAMRAADPRSGVFVVMGSLVSIAYETRKQGDSRPTIYEHEFDSPRPFLTYAESSDHALAIAGGGYRVTWRGIVG